MGKQEWLRSHVERCLQDIWDVCRVTTDSDDEYGFRYGTAAGFVRIDTGHPKTVRVWAIAARNVPRSAKLLGELNDINLRTRTAWVSRRSNGLVIVEQPVLARTMTRFSLGQALHAVGQTADEIGLMIAAVFGGETPYQPGDAEVAEDTA